MFNLFSSLQILKKILLCLKICICFQMTKLFCVNFSRTTLNHTLIFLFYLNKLYVKKFIDILNKIFEGYAPKFCSTTLMFAPEFAGGF